MALIRRSSWVLWLLNRKLRNNTQVLHHLLQTDVRVQHLPAGQDAGGGEEDDGHRVGGAQQPVAVERRRDLFSQLLAQHHPGGGGQLPAIRKKSAAEGGAPRGIQRPGGQEMHVRQPPQSGTQTRLPQSCRRLYSTLACTALLQLRSRGAQVLARMCSEANTKTTQQSHR